MATRTIVLLEDDLTGGLAAETVRFGLDGKAFEIDLSAKNADRLRRALAAYVSAGRRLGRVSARHVGSVVPRQWESTEDDAAAMRQWALENGYEVSARGRIPAYIRLAYLSA